MESIDRLKFKIFATVVVMIALVTALEARLLSQGGDILSSVGKDWMTLAVVANLALLVLFASREKLRRLNGVWCLAIVIACLAAGLGHVGAGLNQVPGKQTVDYGMYLSLQGGFFFLQEACVLTFAGIVWTASAPQEA